MKRKEQAMLAKQKILETTEDLIRTKGYNNISIRDITNACGMSPGNFYHYFRSKEDVFMEVDSVKYYNMMSSLKTNRDASTLVRIESFFMEWVELMLTHYGYHYMSFWLQHYICGTDGSATDSRVDIIKNYFLLFLQEGVLKRELKMDTPVESLAFTLSFTLLGCISYFVARNNPNFLSQWTKEFCQTTIQNILTPYLTSTEL